MAGCKARVLRKKEAHVWITEATRFNFSQFRIQIAVGLRENYQSALAYIMLGIACGGESI